MLVVFEPTIKYTLFLLVIKYVLMVQINMKCERMLFEITRPA